MREEIRELSELVNLKEKLNHMGDTYSLSIAIMTQVDLIAALNKCVVAEVQNKKEKIDE